MIFLKFCRIRHKRLYYYITSENFDLSYVQSYGDRYCTLRTGYNKGKRIREDWCLLSWGMQWKSFLVLIRFGTSRMTEGMRASIHKETPWGSSCHIRYLHLLKTKWIWIQPFTLSSLTQFCADKLPFAQGPSHGFALTLHRKIQKAMGKNIISVNKPYVIVKSVILDSIVRFPDSAVKSKKYRGNKTTQNVFTVATDDAA